MKNHQKLISISGASLLAGPLFLAQGCLATRDWVKEQMDPVSARISQGENRINQAEGQLSALGGRLTGIEGNVGQIDGRLGHIDGRLGQIDGKAEKALSGLANLRLERKLVIDFRDGATFAFNSANVSAEAKKEIDAFLSDAKGDLAATEGAIVVVAGHTDNMGPEEFNYELGRKRADGIARYLIIQKSIDPLRVVTVSYGKNKPVAENNSQQGRAKNRRVEILVYRDGISSTPTAAVAPKPLADSTAARPAGDEVTTRESETLAARSDAP